MRNRMHGVTLIELLVVVVVLSIVLGIGVPGYRQYIMRANRADATTSLLRLAAAQERFFITNGTYASEAQRAILPPAGLGMGASERGYYNLAIAPAAGGLAVGYTASATVNGAERQADDTECATFTLNERGQRAAQDNGGGDSTENCWR
jgi:type IV pilus assembly protein PilE